ncbi:hypothetical protein ACP4OV_023247 [Aristida adscensionis]
MRLYVLTVTARMLLLTVAAMAVATAGAAPLQLSWCPISCRDVIVPYPFGLRPGCYLRGFGLTCDTSHTPPRLLLGGDGGGNLEVADISLDNSTMHVRTLSVTVRGDGIPSRTTYSAMALGAAGAGGASTRGARTSSRRDGTCSSSRPVKLSLLGTDHTINGCASFCYIGDDLVKHTVADGGGDGTCSGVGCC